MLAEYFYFIIEFKFCFLEQNGVNFMLFLTYIYKYKIEEMRPSGCAKIIIKSDDKTLKIDFVSHFHVKNR